MEAAKTARVNIEVIGYSNGKSSFGNGPSMSLDDAKESVLSAHNINYVVPVSQGCCKGNSDKLILNDVTAVFRQGMNAIMGPTGCGKSSFLDVLAGRKDPKGISGTILLDGKPVPENFKCMVGYVVQDDVVMGTLTVKENFAFSAALRLPSSIKASERKQRVEQVVKELGLQKCADTKVGNEFIRGVSGGERKRCNIGMELIISPPVLFLDEPTTGLDANTANVVLMFLRRLSRRRTIIFSIHQPRFSIYRLFDNLMLLSNGCTVYHGPAKDGLEFFEMEGYHCHEHNNPPDFFLDVINGDRSILATEGNMEDDAGIDQESEPVSQHDKLVTDFKKSRWFDELHTSANAIYSEFNSQRGQGMKPERIEYATSFFTQLVILAKRSVLNLVRNPQTAGMTVGSGIFFSIIIAALFWQLDDDMNGLRDREGVLFFVCMNQMFFNMPAVEIFINDRKLFLHENSSGFYRVSVYFIVKVIFDIVPLRVIPAIILAVMVYFSVDLREGADHFFLFTLSIFVICLAAACLCFLMSSLLRVFAAAQLSLVLCYVLMILFGGFLVNLDSIADGISWLQYVSIFKYGLASVYINEFKDREFCNANGTCTSGNERLEMLNMDYKTDWDLYHNYVAMLGIGFGFLILAYLRLLLMKKTT